MPRTSRWMVGQLALALLLGATGAADRAIADMLLNGSFETGPSMPTGTQRMDAGSTAITSWLVTSGSVDYYDVSFWETEDGNRSVGLNGDQPGAIAQSFSTSPGSVYSVSFWMAGEPFTDPVIKHLRASAAGQSGDFIFDSASSWHWSMGWQHHSFNFAAVSASTTLEFRSLDPGTDSPVIDNVSVGLAPAGVDATGDPGLWLAAPRPNPVHARARFEYSLPTDGVATLSVVDLTGRTVASLAGGWHAAGVHSAEWTPGPRGGRAGVYFLRLQSPSGSRITRFSCLP